MNTRTQVKAMELKTRAQGVKDELQIGTNTQVRRNLDGNNTKRKKNTCNRDEK
jgi:hypothetical protein